MLKEIMHMSGMVMFLSLLISFTIAFLHYVALSYLTTCISKIKNVKQYHFIGVMFTIIILHVISILIYAGVYYLMINVWGIGHINGFENEIPTYEDYAYYSITVYTSLGFGDVTPAEGLRFFTGLETLNGVTLIAWSASYSYFMMSQYWGIKNPEVDNKFNDS